MSKQRHIAPEWPRVPRMLKYQGLWDMGTHIMLYGIKHDGFSGACGKAGKVPCKINTVYICIEYIAC